MCQSLEVVLQQSKDDRDTSWTAWFSKSHQMIQEGWQSLYSISNIAGVILGFTWASTTYKTPPDGTSPSAKRRLSSKSYLQGKGMFIPTFPPLSALTVKSYLRPHSSSCKTRSLKKRERVTTLLFILHLQRITDKDSTDTLQPATSGKVTHANDSYNYFCLLY